MNNTEFDKALALAGVCQAASLVKQFARQGKADEQAFKASINSLLITDPEQIEDVFGELPGLVLGFTTLEAQLSNKPAAKDAEITRYIASILGLERKLSRNRKSLNELGERISHIKRQQSLYDLMDEPSLANLARIYSDVISPIGPKIQVAGEPDLLKQNSIQHRVRACLLAGVRAAVLWRQLGGKRRQILFSRKSILSCAEQALQRLNASGA
ncbi:high frequency lysogenization protein HflD [Lacimicrobium alkaliphilum]|uniref:High frequency lysogenization protein HflD homolog n=1 Tax=Lacimicrobium alkaliphilum TaxID=1526571 RepID=A0ABQ1R2H5_9ALTE|nr:high frequency lysogenization protein HflD [Lacimicrobium alkaliphilum]GGD53731.1 high frequency lysogenization protein HflD [Lacimicrobium alkaliphilum]